MYIAKNLGIIPTNTKLIKVKVMGTFYYTPDCKTLKMKILLDCKHVEKDTNNFTLVVSEFNAGTIVTFYNRNEAVRHNKEYDLLPSTFKVVRSTEEVTVVAASKNKYRTTKVETKYLRIATTIEIEEHNNATNIIVFTSGDITREEKL